MANPFRHVLKTAGALDPNLQADDTEYVQRQRGAKLLGKTAATLALSSAVIGGAVVSVDRIMDYNEQQHASNVDGPSQPTATPEGPAEVAPVQPSGMNEDTSPQGYEQP